MRSVNLFNIGAMRAGTTTIYHCLAQHPDIFMPAVKEPSFFIAETYRKRIERGQAGPSESERYEAFVERGRYRTEEAYSSLFDDAGDATYLGDGSHYLHNPAAAQVIHDYNSDARIVVSLRNPIDRMYSEYMLHARKGTTTVDFSTFIMKMVEKESSSSWRMKSGVRLHKGCYAEQLTPWIRLFGREQIHVVLYEDIANGLGEVCTGIFRWLGVDESISPHILRAQRGGVPRSRAVMNAVTRNSAVRRLLKKIVPAYMVWKLRDALYSRMLVREEMDEEVRALLRQLYAPHNRDLEELISLDLSSWQ